MIHPQLLTQARARIESLLGEMCGIQHKVRVKTDRGDWVDTYPVETIVICDVQSGAGFEGGDTGFSRDRQIGSNKTAFYFPHGTAIHAGTQIRRVSTDTLYQVIGPTEESSDDLALEVFANIVMEKGI